MSGRRKLTYPELVVPGHRQDPLGREGMTLDNVRRADKLLRGFSWRQEPINASRWAIGKGAAG